MSHFLIKLLLILTYPKYLKQCIIKFKKFNFNILFIKNISDELWLFYLKIFQKISKNWYSQFIFICEIKIILMIIPTFLIVGLILVIYWMVYKPFRYFLFYRSNKHTKAIFVPVVSTFPLGKIYVDQYDDYYHAILEEKKKNSQLKVYGRNIGTTYMLYILDPIYTREMFVAPDTHIQKHMFQNNWVRTLAPFGLVLSEGNLWKKHRKLFAKGFSYQRIEQSLDTVLKMTEEKINKLIDGQSIPAIPYFKQVAGGLLSQAFFGFDVNTILVDGIPFPLYLAQLISDVSCESYSYSFSLFGINLVKTKMFKQHRQLCQKIEKMRQAVRDVVLKYAQLSKKQSPQVNNMWNIFFKNDDPFNEEQIVDQFITFFSDGVYTSGHFMAMTCYYLANNPEWQQKIREELNDLQLLRKQESLAKLEILRGCIFQTLRLAPPVVTGIQRIVLQDMYLNKEYPLKKGTMVMACHIVNHLDPNFHDDPLKYNPQRWYTQSKTLQTLKKYPASYIPFSIGARNCPGQHFAKAQGTIFLGLLLKKFKLQMKDKNYHLKFAQKFLRQPLHSFDIKLIQLTTTKA